MATTSQASTAITGDGSKVVPTAVCPINSQRLKLIKKLPSPLKTHEPDATAEMAGQDTRDYRALVSKMRQLSTRKQTTGRQVQGSLLPKRALLTSPKPQQAELLSQGFLSLRSSSPSPYFVQQQNSAIFIRITFLTRGSW